MNVFAAPWLALELVVSTTHRACALTNRPAGTFQLVRKKKPYPHNPKAQEWPSASAGHIMLQVHEQGLLIRNFLSRL